MAEDKYTAADSLYHSVYAFGWRNGWPAPIKAKFPDSWGDAKAKKYVELYQIFGHKKDSDEDIKNDGNEEQDE